MATGWIEPMDEDGAEPHDLDHDLLHADKVGDRVKIDGDFGLANGLATTTGCACRVGRGDR